MPFLLLGVFADLILNSRKDAKPNFPLLLLFLRAHVFFPFALIMLNDWQWFSLRLKHFYHHYHKQPHKFLNNQTLENLAP